MSLDREEKEKAIKNIQEQRCSDCPPWDKMAGRCHMCVDLHKQEQVLQNDRD